MQLLLLPVELHMQQVVDIVLLLLVLLLLLLFLLLIQRCCHIDAKPLKLPLVFLASKKKQHGLCCAACSFCFCCSGCFC